MYNSKTSRLLALSVTTAISLTTSVAIAGNSTQTNFGSNINDATDRGDLSLVQNLINTGANPNQRGEFGTTPLMRAARSNNLQLISVLISGGADVNLADIGGATAVSVAARNNYNSALAMLIKAGANVNTADNEGFTPLMRATLANNAEAVQMLISVGAKINISNNFDETALSQANSPNIAQILVSNGADDRLKTKLAQLANAREVAENTTDDNKADINIDFSNGRLGENNSANNYAPVAHPIATTTQNQYYAGSYYVPEKTEVPSSNQLAPVALQQDIILPETTIQTPSKPQNSFLEAPQLKNTMLTEAALDWVSSVRRVASAAVRPYQISSNEMVAPVQTAILELGNFKTENFANKKIASLKKSLPQIFGTLELKAVPKNIHTGITYQINAGLTTPDQAKILCKQLIAAGVNCHVEASNMQTQQEFENYAGDAPKNAAGAVAAQNQNSDLIGGAPAAKVENRQLSSSAAPQPVTDSGHVIDAYAADYTLISPAAGDSSSDSSSAGSAPTKSILQNNNANNTTAANSSAAPSASSQMLKIIAPTNGSAAPAPATSATTTTTITPLNPNPAPTPLNPTPAATSATTTTTTTSTVPAPSSAPLPPISAATAPQPAASTSTTTISTTPTTSAAPQAVISVQDTKPDTTTQDAAANPATTADGNQPEQPVKKKKVVHHHYSSHYSTAPGTGEPPRDLATGQPIGAGVGIDGKFDVARPVKSAAVTADIPLSQQVWIKIGNFANSEAAHSYWNSLRSQNTTFANLHERTEVPFTRPDLTSMEVGPFASAAEGDNACVAIQQNGLNCTKTDTLPPRMINNLPAPNSYIDDHNMPLVNDYDIGNGNWNIQLGSYDSYEEAQSKWNDIAAGNKHLKKIKADIVAANGKYRLRAGNFNSSGKADALCDELRNQGISCIIIKE